MGTPNVFAGMGGVTPFGAQEPADAVSEAANPVSPLTADVLERQALDYQQKELRWWRAEIVKANTLYKKWETKYHCDELENLYLGHHWEGDDTHEKYIVNLFYSGIETRKPALMFGTPLARVRPRPNRGDDPMSTVDLRAKLLEDTANTLLQDADIDFVGEASLALHESFFRFGVIEVGYDASAVTNPNQGKPVLDKDTNRPLLDEKGALVVEPAEVIESESCYVKYIPARDFRISAPGHPKLEKNDWCGYREWIRIEDLKSDPAIVPNMVGLKSDGRVPGEPIGETTDETSVRSGYVLCWKIWDLRAKEFLLFADHDHDRFLLRRECPFLPVALLKHHDITGSPYPLPPTFAWRSQQREMDDTRETQRAHRKRFYRRYTVLFNQIDPDELDKLEDGGDGVYAFVNKHDVIKAVEDAPLDAAIDRNIPYTLQDFMLVSGITGEQRGVQEAETATQANIIDVNSRIREQFQRGAVGRWLAKAVYLMLRTLQEYATLSFMIRTNVDPQSQVAVMEAMEIQYVWRTISPDLLGDQLDWDVSIDVESLKSGGEDRDRARWNEVLAIITNPSLMMVLAMSDVILRKTLSLYEVKGEKEIQEIKSVLQKLLYMQVMMAAAGGPGGEGGGEKGGKGKEPKAGAPGKAGPTDPREIVGALHRSAGQGRPQ